MYEVKKGKQETTATSTIYPYYIYRDNLIVYTAYRDFMPFWVVAELLNSETALLHTEIERLKAENARLQAKAQALAELRDNLLKQEQAIKDAPDVIAMGMAFDATNGIEKEIINLVKGESE